MPPSKSETPQRPSYEYRWMLEPAQRKMLAERMVDIAHELEENQTEAVIFLDKSARPLSTLFKDIWEKMHEKTGQKPPAIFFMQIGNETNKYIEDKIYQSHPELFHKHSDLPSDERGFFLFYDIKQWPAQKIVDLFEPQEIKRMRQTYPGLQKVSRVAIIDDTEANGDTLFVAKKLAQGLFPNIKEIDARALAYIDHDLLFHDASKKIGWFDASWRHSQKSLEGKTGVTDGEAGKLTATPALPGKSGPERQELAADIRSLHKEMHAIADEYWKRHSRKSPAEIKASIAKTRGPHIEPYLRPQEPPPAAQPQRIKPQRTEGRTVKTLVKPKADSEVGWELSLSNDSSTSLLSPSGFQRPKKKKGLFERLKDWLAT